MGWNDPTYWRTSDVCVDPGGRVYVAYWFFTRGKRQPVTLRCYAETGNLLWERRVKWDFWRETAPHVAVIPLNGVVALCTVGQRATTGPGESWRLVAFTPDGRVTMDKSYSVRRSPVEKSDPVPLGFVSGDRLLVYMVRRIAVSETKIMEVPYIELYGGNGRLLSSRESRTPDGHRLWIHASAIDDRGRVAVVGCSDVHKNIFGTSACGTGRAFALLDETGNPLWVDTPQYTCHGTVAYQGKVDARFHPDGTISLLFRESLRRYSLKGALLSEGYCRTKYPWFDMGLCSLRVGEGAGRIFQMSWTWDLREGLLTPWRVDSFDANWNRTGCSRSVRWLMPFVTEDASVMSAGGARLLAVAGWRTYMLAPSKLLLRVYRY